MLIKELKSIGVIQRGDFTFKSGKKSSIYFDLRRLFSYPAVMEKVVNALHTLVGNEYDHVCGVPTAGIPYASIFSSRFSIPLLLLRNEKKEHGTKKLLEGVYKRGDTVLLLEDVVTTGGSIEEAKKSLESEGLIVKKIAVIIDRREENDDIVSLFTMKDLLKREFYNHQAEEIWKVVQRKKSNICFSCDGGDLEMLKRVAPYVCMVKIHMDTGVGNWLLDIYDLANQYDFIVLDDRKYADIGSIVQKQAVSGLCTAHSIFGQSTVNGLKHLDGCFLIAQVSTEGNLITPVYSQMTFELAKDNLDVVCGFICQDSHFANSDPGFLYLSPGVAGGANNDGQVYKGVEDTILLNLCDILIIGRAIYNNPDNVVALRDTAWKALCLREGI